MVLTGKINGSSVANRLNLDWFNAQVRQKFKESIEAGNTPDLPTIEIEVYFASPDEDEIAIKKYRGTNNSLHEDAEGVKLEIIFDTQYAPAYKQLLVEGKPLTVVTDNDGNVEAVRKRYEKYTGLVTLCVESDNTLNTLEPSVLAANLDTFESFKSIIYLGKDIESRDPDSIKSFMIGNKTDWSMRVFTSEKKINYPSYILKAIGIDSENMGDRDE